MHEVIFFSIVLILLIILLGYLFYLALAFYGSYTSFAPFVPVGDHALETIIMALELDDASRLYDLGSGEGRVLGAALKRHAELSAVGIEIALLPRTLSKLRLRKWIASGRVEIRNQDLFLGPISDATHIFVYLLPKVMVPLEEKCNRELHKGTRVVSCDFEFPHKTPAAVIALPGNHALGKKLFVYIF